MSWRSRGCKKFIKKHDILIIPLKTASGLRIKIVEAMAAGKIVISSTVGVRGINAIDGKHYLNANYLESYDAAINILKSDLEKCKKIKENAISLIKRDFENSTVLNSLLDLYKSLL